jgi:hypothetical protein
LNNLTPKWKNKSEKGKRKNHPSGIISLKVAQSRLKKTSTGGEEALTGW